MAGGAGRTVLPASRPITKVGMQRWLCREPKPCLCSSVMRLTTAHLWNPWDPIPSPLLMRGVRIVSPPRRAVMSSSRPREDPLLRCAHCFVRYAGSPSMSLRPTRTYMLTSVEPDLTTDLGVHGSQPRRSLSSHAPILRGFLSVPGRMADLRLDRVGGPPHVANVPSCLGVVAAQDSPHSTPASAAE